jgi:hypothetical protein
MSDAPDDPADDEQAVGDTENSSPPTHLSNQFSGALRTFAFWVANGTVGIPLLEGIDYWADMRESPSLMEQTFAIFANVIRLDGEGRPLNAKEAERRAAEWIRQYMTGQEPERPWEGWEVALH